MPLLLGLIVVLLAGFFIVAFPSTACPHCLSWPGNYRDNTPENLRYADASPNILCGFCKDRKRVALLKKWRYVRYVRPE